MSEATPFNDQGCAKLLQAIVLSAVEAVQHPQGIALKQSIGEYRDPESIVGIELRHKRRMAEVVHRAIEFAERDPNIIFDFYEELFEADIPFLRQRIIRLGTEKLKELHIE